MARHLFCVSKYEQETPIVWFTKIRKRVIIIIALFYNAERGKGE